MSDTQRSPVFARLTPLMSRDMIGHLVVSDANVGRLAKRSQACSFKHHDQCLARGMETGVDEGYPEFGALIAETR